MPEKSLENNFLKNERREEVKLKYPIEPLDFDEDEDRDKIIEYEVLLSEEEISKVLEVCSNGNDSTIDLLKKYSSDVGFKKLIISPFYENWHVYPNSDKSDESFIPIKHIPRLNNLLKIDPVLAENGIETNMGHEQQHVCAGASFAHKKSAELNHLELQANLQNINRLNRENKINVDNCISSIAVDCVFHKTVSDGAQRLEDGDFKSNALEWFNAYYSFLRVKREGEFADMGEEELASKTEKYFLRELDKAKKDILEKYDKYIKENGPEDFYNQEDKDCEELRIEAINSLNEMAK